MYSERGMKGQILRESSQGSRNCAPCFDLFKERNFSVIKEKEKVIF